MAREHHPIGSRERTYCLVCHARFVKEMKAIAYENWQTAVKEGRTEAAVHHQKMYERL